MTNKLKKVVVLGSTGSLGTQTLKILEKYKKHFKIIGLSANTNIKILNEQAKKFKISPKNTVLASKFKSSAKKALLKMIESKNTDIIINVLSGVAGIDPSIAALKAGKILLLGNKESLFAEGRKIMNLSKKNHAKIIPLDSEHNAIFEILKKYPGEKIKNIIIPCSGGPFLNKKAKYPNKVTIKEALAHPKWKMGKKVSIESATLINKGLEIIEAHYLFNLPLRKIITKIHPQCSIHGIVEFKDKFIAYFGKPNMKEHLENALLSAANLPLLKREIKQINLGNFQLQSIPNHLTPGLKIILDAFGNFKSTPEKLKKFLQKEEALVKDFLHSKIPFKKIISTLQKLK